MHRYLIKAAVILTAGLSFISVNANANIVMREHASACAPIKSATNGSLLTNLRFSSGGFKNIGGSSIKLICPLPNGDRYGSLIGIQVRFLGAGSAQTYKGNRSTDLVLGPVGNAPGVAATSPTGVSLAAPTDMGLQNPAGVIVTVPGGATFIGYLVVATG